MGANLGFSRHLMMRLRALASAAFLLSAPHGLAQETPLAADTPKATPAGVTFTAPSSWRPAASANSVALDAPEADTRMVVVDAPGTRVEDAVAAAWSAYRSDPP